MACGISVPPPGIEPTHSGRAAWNLNHWTTGEVPNNIFFKTHYIKILSFQHGIDIKIINEIFYFFGTKVTSYIFQLQCISTGTHHILGVHA